jgi:hypothetical protein
MTTILSTPFGTYIPFQKKYVLFQFRSGVTMSELYIADGRFAISAASVLPDHELAVEYFGTTKQKRTEEHSLCSISARLLHTVAGASAALCIHELDNAEGGTHFFV